MPSSWGSPDASPTKKIARSTAAATTIDPSRTPGRILSGWRIVATTVSACGGLFGFEVFQRAVEGIAEHLRVLAYHRRGDDVEDVVVRVFRNALAIAFQQLPEVPV